MLLIDKPGFELNRDPAYTFLYSQISFENDTGLPCFSIPITDQLISYVAYRGPEVISVEDLSLIGNCSRTSYCDKKTKTCQPKRTLGSRCQYNMQCMMGDSGIPGHCSNKSVCEIRQDLPPYYYSNTREWKVGKEWPAAVIALITAGVVVGIIFAVRHFYPRFIKSVLTKWQTKNSTMSSADPTIYENEEAWNRHHKRWWKHVPGVNWVYSRLKRSNNREYHPLDDRTEEPPPYNEN